MKKLLLASTALVLSGGVAAADVTLSGDGRMGVNRFANSVPAVPVTGLEGSGTTTRVEGRVRITAALTRSGDHGLSFGGSLRLGQTWTNSATAALGPQMGSVWIGAGGFRLTYGDVDGAIANTLPLYGGGLGFTGRVGRVATHAGYGEGDGGVASVRADYSMSGFTVSASTRPNVANTSEIAIAYSASGFGVSAGYHEGGNWSVAGTYAMGDFGVGILHSRAGANNNTRVWGTYDMGAVRLAATVGRVAGMTSGGLGVRYSLGGGANFHAAIGTEFDGGTVAPAPATPPARQTTGQIGVTFAF